MTVTTKSTRAAIVELEGREKALLDDIKKAEAEVSKIRTARLALLALETDDPAEFDGKLVDAVRAVLTRNAGVRSLAPMDVRDEVKALGYDFSKLKHGNEMAAVHGVLKRLVDSGVARPKKMRDGSTRYVWLGNAADMVLRPDYITFTTGEPLPTVAANLLKSNEDLAAALRLMQGSSPSETIAKDLAAMQQAAERAVEDMKKFYGAVPVADVNEAIGLKLKK